MFAPLCKLLFSRERRVVAFGMKSTVGRSSGSKMCRYYA